MRIRRRAPRELHETPNPKLQTVFEVQAKWPERLNTARADDGYEEPVYSLVL